MLELALRTIGFYYLRYYLSKGRRKCQCIERSCPPFFLPWKDLRKGIETDVGWMYNLHFYPIKGLTQMGKASLMEKG
jgi:hypothetical protein